MRVQGTTSSAPAVVSVKDLKKQPWAQGAHSIPVLDLWT